MLNKVFKHYGLRIRNRVKTTAKHIYGFDYSLYYGELRPNRDLELQGAVIKHLCIVNRFRDGEFDDEYYMICTSEKDFWQCVDYIVRMNRCEEIDIFNITKTNSRVFTLKAKDIDDKDLDNVGRKYLFEMKYIKDHDIKKSDTFETTFCNIHYLPAFKNFMEQYSD